MIVICFMKLIFLDGQSSVSFLFIFRLYYTLCKNFTLKHNYYKNVLSLILFIQWFNLFFGAESEEVSVFLDQLFEAGDLLLALVGGISLGEARASDEVLDANLAVPVLALAHGLDPGLKLIATLK